MTGWVLMSVIGFILITTEMGKEDNVQKTLSEIELYERYVLQDLANKEFDILIIANATDSASLERFVTDVIKPIPGIAGIKAILGIDVGSSAKLRNPKPIRKLWSRHRL